ncbi:hypothetical protein NEOLEDRAFT_1242890 [Neolentinus lepideus HHB14362 ss-1]|uniref:Uncharacterized protein n=1 Tax=Neolentinus lepideus HHB14362 ss-1 TaxID=1314782 RepID=A0A165RL35_9AGAM|nr:hypothetical protein NEOLEDRAFT_1242890 [Neolentinus lepideus HHB14362 ss-1]
MSGAPARNYAPSAPAGPTQDDVEASGAEQQTAPEEPFDAAADWESRNRVVYASGRVAPLDYVSDSLGPPVFLCEAFTAPANLQKHSHPDPVIADVRKPSHTSSMPFSHMGIYRSEDMLGKKEDVPAAPQDATADGRERPRGLMMHAPTAPPPYPKPTDVHSWVWANETALTPIRGPASAPVDCHAEATYPTSVSSLDRPFNWIEDVKADQPIEADGFKRCSRCAISYRITDGKRCRCTPSEGDGERPI